MRCWCVLFVVVLRWASVAALSAAAPPPPALPRPEKTARRAPFPRRALKEPPQAHPQKRPPAASAHTPTPGSAARPPAPSNLPFKTTPPKRSPHTPTPTPQIKRPPAPPRPHLHPRVDAALVDADGQVALERDAPRGGVGRGARELAVQLPLDPQRAAHLRPPLAVGAFLGGGGGLFCFCC